MLYPATKKYNTTLAIVSTMLNDVPFHSSHKDFTDYRIVTKKQTA